MEKSRNNIIDNSNINRVINESNNKLLIDKKKSKIIEKNNFKDRDKLFKKPSTTAKRKTIFFIGKSPFCLPKEDVGARKCAKNLKFQ